MIKRSLIVLVFLLSLQGCDLNLGGTKSGDDTETTTTIINGEDSEGAGGFGENPRCVGVQSLDGAGGFLWKVESESDGKLVILFPTEYQGIFLQVLVYRTDGTAESGVFAGFTNDNRQTYRFKDTGHAYTGKIEVDAGDQRCEWLVPDPTKNQD